LSNILCKDNYDGYIAFAEEEISKKSLYQNIDTPGIIHSQLG